MDDPCQWSVDQVVDALCNPNATFRTSADPGQRPDPSFLEAKLREQYIDGTTLLTDIDHKSLREDIGIQPLGQRSTILREIKRLQRRSQKYGELRRQSLSAETSFASENIWHSIWHRTTSSGSTATLEASLANDLQSMTLPTRSPDIRSISPDNRTTSHRDVNDQNFFAPEDTGQGNKSPKSSAILAQDSLQEPATSGSFPLGSIPESTSAPSLSHETYIVDKTGRKRRRLVLGQPEMLMDLTSPVIKEKGHIADTDIPTKSQCIADVDAEMHDNFGNNDSVSCTGIIQSGLANSSSIEEQIPGSTITNEKGRKRIAPTLVSQLKHDCITYDAEPSSRSEKRLSIVSNRLDIDLHNRNLDENSSARRPDQTYLGFKALPVDSIFYGDNSKPGRLAKGSDSDNDADEFIFSTFGRFSDGQRRYVNSRLNYFYKSTTQSLIDRDRSFVKQIPYPSEVVRTHGSLFMTTYEKTPEGIVVSKANRLEDPAHILDASKLDSLTENVFATKNTANADDVDWSYLEKWNNADGVNTVLPVYGDSGSEGQYDLETWREMEAEQGSKIERPLYRSKRKKLEIQQVINAIDGEVEHLIERWKLQRWNKLRQKEWQLWTKSRRGKNTITLQVERFSASIMNLDKRLDKMRQEIVNEEWNSIKAVSKQCQILEPTIFEREDLKWKISVLQQPRAPEKPTKTRKLNTIGKPELALFSADDEGFQTEQSSLGISEDSLGSFVVSDGNVDMEIANSQRPFVDTDSEEGKEPAQGEPTPTPGNGFNRSNFKHEERGPFSPPSERASTGNHDIIDLTMCSSDAEAQVDKKSVRTPSPFHIASDEDPFIRTEKKRKAFKIPPSTTRSAGVVNLDSDSAYKSENLPINYKLPELHEIGKIAQMDPKLLEERQDRKRLLLYHLAKVSDVKRTAAFERLEKPLQEVKAEVWSALKNIVAHCYKIRGMPSEGSAAVMLLAGLYVSWTVPTVLRPLKGIKRKDVNTAEADEEGFEDFFNFLNECKNLYYFDKPQASSAAVVVPKPPPTEMCLGSSNSDLEPNPFSNRRKPVTKNQEASQHREKAQQRVKELERRQTRLKQRLQAMGRNDDDASSIFVNSGVLEGENLIYLNPLIGARIQPHQKDGVRFIWREIIEDHATNQGCLLAQAMGLGKTMQVISFLVTLAEAANSKNKKIQQQIPKRLRDSRTLVLCPPALVENWFEEFLMWTPQPMSENIGDVWKINADMTLDERIRRLDEWAEGGVLVLGYSIFRDLLNNQNGKLDKDQHKMVTDVILEGSDIVVADEAHAMKNVKSATHRLVRKFRTGSRIALTGSPLSNNLKEYYALIEWVAPGYLGDQTEFHQHYETPITEGLYVDSLPSQWRNALKRLELFKREVQPKVHRADMSVLTTRTKGKSEFVIKFPLSALQAQLYRAFAETTTHRHGKTGKVAFTDMWGWLSMLRLICNHPKCFRVRMLERLKEKPGETKGKQNSLAPSAVIEGIEVQDGDKDATLITPDDASSTHESLLAPFHDVVDVDSVTLAYKMVALRHIVDHSLRAGDKVLVFSHSILTLDYVQGILREFDSRLQRMDGKTNTAQRQNQSKDFNQGEAMVLLVSTRAGGTGLNLFGANRVVILDDHFNPMWEEQAIGRAYRIGQQKHVFIYRLTVGGTFEEVLHNQSLFKRQLATRAVDKKNPIRKASRQLQTYFKPPEDVPLEDLEPLVGKDKFVLDKILALQGDDRFICSIVPSETFNLEDDDLLTAEEQKEVEQEEAMKQNRRKNLAGFNASSIGASSPSSNHLSNKQADSSLTQPVSKVTPAPQPPGKDHVAITSPLKSLRDGENSRLSSAAQAEKKYPADNAQPGMLPILGAGTRMGARVSLSPEKSLPNNLVSSRAESEPVRPVAQPERPSEIARRKTSFATVNEVPSRSEAHSRRSPPIIGKDNSEPSPGLIKPNVSGKPEVQLDEPMDQNPTSKVSGKVRKASDLSDYPQLQDLLDREAKKRRVQL
ncbi:MAG: hypothetical protein Q9167_002968 [Letrouitia subvulpina]